MTCEVQIRDGIVHISGEMTIYSAQPLRDALIEALDRDRTCSLVDLAEVAELDTSGVQILMVAQRICTARGAAFQLANPSAVVRETLDLLQITSLPFASHEGASA